MALKPLRIGKAGQRVFTLPVDFATQKAAFLGRTGSGKTYAAMKTAEQMLKAGVQTVILDVVGVWWGLRLDRDGESMGIDIPVIGGLRGDIPLEPTAGALIADLIADRHMSVVLDLSQFESDADKARFARDFADRFFRRMKAAPAPVHIFLEECQEFVPQNIQRGEEKMLHYWTRIAKLGRNFGIGLSLISQRPQEVSKKALNMTECLFAFQMTGQHERKAIRDWLGTKGSEHDITEVLRRLPVGTAHVSSPQWLDFEGLVAVDERQTYDSSSTPSFLDTNRADPPDLATLDLEGLQEAMAETVAEAQANDPKVLKHRVAELEAELRNSAIAPDPVDVAMASMEERDRYVMAALEKQRAEWNERLRPLFHSIRAFGPGVEKLADHLMGTAEDLEDVLGDADVDVDLIDTGNGTQPRPVAPAVARQSAPVRPATPRAEGVSGPQQRILDALASLESLGLHEVHKSVVAVFSDASPKSSAFSNNLGHLRSQCEFIVYPRGGHVQLTEAGRAVANGADAPRSIMELLTAWKSKLSAPQGRILDQVFAAYPGSIEKAALADLVGASARSSAYSNNLGRMRSLGIIDYPDRGMVAATELLFPQGLR